MAMEHSYKRRCTEVVVRHNKPPGAPPLVSPREHPSPRLGVNGTWNDLGIPPNHVTMRHQCLLEDMERNAAHLLGAEHTTACRWPPTAVLAYNGCLGNPRTAPYNYLHRALNSRAIPRQSSSWVEIQLYTLA